jgi:hypothetical protein
VRARQTPDPRALADAVERVRREYLAWPTLRLTQPQVKRLFGLSDNMCAAVLSALLSPGFLVRSADGQYGRAWPAEAAPPAWRARGTSWNPASSA